MKLSAGRRQFAVFAGVLASGVAVLAQVAGGALPSSPQQTQAQQVSFEGTAAVSGVVLDATTKQPIPGVMVYLGFQGRGAVGRLSRQLSDARGRFVFTDLPAGNAFFINASKPGYLEGHLGVGSGGLLGGLITLTDGQWFADATVLMTKPGAISGVVVDERGEPAVGAFVRALARVVVGGKTRLASGRVVRTDDRGVYRIAELIPGRYMVQVPFVQQAYSSTITAAELAGLTPEQAATRPAPDLPQALDLGIGAKLVVGNYLAPPPPVDGRLRAYPPLFHPGVTAVASASAIDLRAGEERTGVNISLQSLPATSIAGTVEAPGGASVAGAIVRLVPDGLEEMGTGSEVATSTIGADGRFVFASIPTGAYTIDVRRNISELQYRPGLVTTVNLPSPPGVAGTSSGSLTSAPDGARYVAHGVRADVPFFGQQKITVDAKPITDLIVTLRRGSTIRGRFVMENGAALPDTPGAGIVDAEPADGGPGMVSSSRALPSAAQRMETFEVTGIPPGSYYLRFLGLPGNGLAMSVIGEDGVDHRLKPFDTTTGRDYNVVATITTRRIDLSGAAAESSGAQVKHAVVVVFPVERDQWTNYSSTAGRLRSTPTTSSGTYRFQSLQAGDYYIAAVPPEQAGQWRDPEKLAQLAAQAARITLAWGDVKVQSVPVVRLR